jgi:hypothetical protein
VIAVREGQERLHPEVSRYRGEANPKIGQDTKATITKFGIGSSYMVMDEREDAGMLVAVQWLLAEMVSFGSYR